MIVPVPAASPPAVLVVNENVTGTGVLPATRSDSFIVKERRVTCFTTGSTIWGNAPVEVISMGLGGFVERSLEVAAVTLHLASWGFWGVRNVSKITVIITLGRKFLAVENSIVKIVNGSKSVEDTLHSVGSGESNPLGKIWQ